MTRQPTPRTMPTLCLTLLLILPVFAGQSADTLVASDGMKFAVDRPFDIEHIRLDLHVELEQKFVRGRARISGKALRPLASVAFDAVGFEDVRVMTQTSASAADQASFINDGERIIVTPDEPLAAGDAMDFFIDYSLNEPKSGLHFFAPSEEEPDTPYLVWSQGQSIDNRHWVPCFDHPNEMQTTEIHCTVEQPYMVISNGTLVSVKSNNDGTRTYHWKQDKPHVSYLITLVVGEFVRKGETWRDIPVGYYARPKHAAKLEHSFNNTLPMLDFFSEKIGVDYPWAKYDQLCCYGFGGGMENTSSTTLGERALYDERRLLDDDPDGLIAHELAHQWYGDLLTCRDWAHLWLNEGFASYFEALWDEEKSGAEAFAYNMRGKARGAIEGGRDKPVVWRDYASPDQQFDSRAYPKGAWVLHMIRRRLGDDLFWRVMKAYTTRFSHQSVDTADLRKTIEELTGRGFERFFYDWTERPGSPDVKVTYSWMADDRLAKLKIEQTQKEDAFHFPLDVEFHFGEGVSPHRITHDVTEKECLVYVPLPKPPKGVRIDPDQAVLMSLTREQPRDIWIEQLRDPSPVARLDAVAHFAKAGGKANIERLIRRLAEDSFWAVRAEIARKLGDEGGDASKAALLGQVETENPRVRAAVVESLAKFTGDDEVKSALARIAERGDPSYRVETAAIRGFAAKADGDAAELLSAALERDSDREVIRVAAIESLGAHGESGGFETLKDWTAAHRPIECRGAALRAIGKLVSREILDEASKIEALDIIGRALDAKAGELRRSALSAAGEMGVEAQSLGSKIAALAEDGPRRMRRTARDTLAKIRKEQKPDALIDELREMISKLSEEKDKLAAELKKLEARVKASTSPPVDTVGVSIE